MAGEQLDMSGVRLGFLGFGNMGNALAGGVIASGLLAAEQVAAYDPQDLARAHARELGISMAASAGDLAAESTVLVVAVKPQILAEALAPVRAALGPDALVVSIAAGISTRFIEKCLGGARRVVRVMPNTPSLAGAGAAGYALNAQCTEADGALVGRLLEATGIAVRVEEEAIDAVTAVSGSGPAYFFFMVECLAAAGEAEGLSRECAEQLAAQTLIGAGRLLEASGEPAGTLRERVTSKGGTTAAALARLHQDKFEAVIAWAVSAAAARSRELGA